MRYGYGLFLLAVLSCCSSKEGSKVDEGKLGYQTCDRYFACGPGRYCNSAGYCWSDCRSTADCTLLGEGLICNRFGQCLPPDGERPCTSHADCGPERYCNGTCLQHDQLCGTNEDCKNPLYPDDTCQGTCGGNCGSDNDCMGYPKDLSCTPIGQCLQTGWERWIPPGEIPPAKCTMDAQCIVLGWNWRCACDKTTNAAGFEVCQSGESACSKREEPLDFGSGPESSPAHGMRGVWGQRFVTAVVTEGLPLINYQNTYSANLFLVKATHVEGDTLQIETRICEIQLINFEDNDGPSPNLAWMLIPSRYIQSLPILTQTVLVSSASAGSTFVPSYLNEVRGVILADPMNDPLPTREDFLANPDDPRFWDQDGDGKVGMTTLMDGVMRGEIYNVQRWGTTYRGVIIDDQHIRGYHEIQDQELLISASKDTLIYSTTITVHKDLDRTYHRWMRMPDDTSCADLLDEGHRNDSYLRRTAHQVHCQANGDCANGEECRYGVCFAAPFPE